MIASVGLIEFPHTRGVAIYLSQRRRGSSVSSRAKFSRRIAKLARPKTEHSGGIPKPMAHVIISTPSGSKLRVVLLSNWNGFSSKGAKQQQSCQGKCFEYSEFAFSVPLAKQRG
jgi:hypothetical protein